MRTPKYSSSDEEPDYYEEFGADIFKRAYLMDKNERFSFNRDEDRELSSLQEKIPAEYIKDYEIRRKYNVEFNVRILDLVENGSIDFFSIPQDD